MTYFPDFDLDRLRGEEAQAFVQATRQGVLLGTTEVKRDDRARETGNFFIEYECQRAAGWHLSGIATTKSATWAQVCWPAFVAAPSWLVLNIAREAYDNPDNRRPGGTNGSHPTRGVTLRVGEFVPMLLQHAWSSEKERAA